MKILTFGFGIGKSLHSEFNASVQRLGMKLHFRCGVLLNPLATSVRSVYFVVQFVPAPRLVPRVLAKLDLLFWVGSLYIPTG